METLFPAPYFHKGEVRQTPLTFLCSSHTIATEPTCSGPSRDSYLGSRIDCRQKIRGYGTRQLSLWGQSAILEGVPLEILAAGSPVWLLISSPSAEAVPFGRLAAVLTVWLPCEPDPQTGADPLSGKA